jgi:hypothetical protein
MSDRDIVLLAVDKSFVNLGVTEVGGENRGAAVESYLASCIPPLPAGSPWCVAHVRFRLKQAATELGLTYDKSMPRTGYTPDYVSWAVQKGLWVPKEKVASGEVKPRKGDLCCFWFPVLNRHAHMGFVHNMNGTDRFLSIEGNTSAPTKVGVEREGDGLYLKTRRLSSLGRKGGFIRLDF